jgi:hypothetical protein
MANHCLYHFKNKITIEEVEKHIRTFCRDRLGDESLVSSNDGYIEVKIPVPDSQYPMSASFFLRNSKTLEHRHVHFGFEFATKIAEYAAWKMKATHGTDEGISEKLGANNFTSKPLIKFIEDYSNGLDSNSTNLFKKLLNPKIKSLYMNEDKFLNKFNKICAFYYIGISENTTKDYEIEHKNLYDKREKEVISQIKDDKYDCFYGNSLRAAISCANYPLALSLIDNGIELKDNIDLSDYNHPKYIKKEYLKDISMPLCVLAVHSIEQGSRPEYISQVISKLIQHGADPFLKDSRGMDSLDCFFLNRTPTKKQSEMIFNAFRENIDPKKLKGKITDSDLTETKKELYLSMVKTFNAKAFKLK